MAPQRARARRSRRDGGRLAWVASWETLRGWKFWSVAVRPLRRRGSQEPALPCSGATNPIPFRTIRQQRARSMHTGTICSCASRAPALRVWTCDAQHLGRRVARRAGRRGASAVQSELRTRTGGACGAIAAARRGGIGHAGIPATSICDLVRCDEQGTGRPSGSVRSCVLRSESDRSPLRGPGGIRTSRPPTRAISISHPEFASDGVRWALARGERAFGVKRVLGFLAGAMPRRTAGTAIGPYEK